jgi:hypothetical protein
MVIKVKYLGSAAALRVIGLVSACAPPQTNLADPTVRGDNSTISGDAAATAIRESQ